MIKDAVYIVTGGGGAIAGHVVRAFVGAGARTAIVARTLAAAQAAADEVQGLPLAADVTTPAGIDGVVRATLETWGRLDGLIHTVGAFAMGPIATATPADYDRMFDANVRTLFYAVRGVLPHLMAQRDGLVAAFSSEPAQRGASPGSALYGAAKAAVANFMHSLDGEVRGTAIRVAVVYPMGAVDTAANRRDMPGVDPATWIDPDEIAATLLHAAERSPRGRVIDLAVYPPR